MRGALVAAVLCAAVLVAGGPPRASAEADAIARDHGVICALAVTSSQDAPGTELGRILLIEQGQPFDVATTVVPARHGLSFGVRVVLPAGAEPVDARMVLTHPPFPSSGVSRQVWDARLEPGQPALNVFSFEYEHERVAGRWIFDLQDPAGETIARQSFDVVDGFGGRAVQRACFGAPLTS